MIAVSTHHQSKEFLASVIALAKHLDALVQKRMLFCASLALLFFNGCVRESKNSFWDENKNLTPLFIPLPSNSLVFDNISALVYEAITHEFQQAGHCLVSNSSKGYSLKITIKSLTPQTKLVSPDVILFHLRINLSLLCELLDFNGNLVDAKTFQGTTLISKPSDPVLKSDFFYFEHKKMLDRLTPQIERYFRSKLITILSKQ